MRRHPEPFRHMKLLFCLAVIVVGGQARAQQEDVVKRGHLLFSWYCATCHGDTAKGNGIMTKVMKIVPADLTQLSSKAGGEFPFWRVYRSVDGRLELPGHETREMPIWGFVFRKSRWDTETQIRDRILDLVYYIESIQAE